MRASRLVALLLHVQRHHGASTAPELARHLEVSVRTIYRDVGRAAGGGGPALDRARTSRRHQAHGGLAVPARRARSEETAALLVGGAGAADLGLGTVLVAAQSKVLTALPPELRARAGRIRERFVLDAPGWFHRPEASPHLTTVAEGVWSGRRLDLGYRSRAGVVARTVDPLGLVLKAGTWYLVAGVSGRPRTYRVSRIEEATVRIEAAERPADFDLAAWWQQSSDEFDLAMRPLAARLRMTPAATSRLAAAVPGPATRAAIDDATPPDGDGLVELTLPMESIEVAVSQLASLGEVEVLAPVALRNALAAHARALATLNR